MQIKRDKGVTTGACNYIRRLHTMGGGLGVTGIAFAVLFLAFGVAFAAAATCPHEDNNWSDPSTWDNGKVMAQVN